MRRRGGTVAGASAAVVVAALVGLLVAAPWSRPDARGAPAAGSRDSVAVLGRAAAASADEDNLPVLRTGPCGGTGATAVPARELQRTSPFPVLLPHSAVASASNMTGSWACPRGSEVELRYASGLSLFVERSSLRDPSSQWSVEAASDPAEASVTSVLSNIPALLITPEASTGAVGSVTLVDGGSQYTLVGNGQLTAADLENTADSLH